MIGAVMQMNHLAKMILLLLLGLFGAAGAQAGGPPPVRIGVLTDMTGPYSDAIGEGSVVAARMAAEDFGNTVLGRPI